MARFLLIMVILALVIPPGISECGGADSGESRQRLIQCSLDEIAATSEGEVEEPELYFHRVPFFWHRVPIDGHLPLFQGDSVTAAAIDPQGCRPPPCV